MNAEAINPLDRLSAADIAVHASRLARLEEAVAVRNNADTINAQLSIVPGSDVQVVAKPQLIETALRSAKDIQKYVTVAGDTVAAVATRFNVTSDSVRWSNSISGDIIPANTELYIPPRNGIVYVVKNGDTVDTLSAKYKANREQLIAFNDAEVSGLQEGQRIVIPDGKVEPVASPISYASFSTGSIQGFTASYSGNGYDYGYCTWYVANKRAASGRPIPANLGNASTWKLRAQAAGYTVSAVPIAGAVAWKVPRDYYGHVAYVESVNADGSVNISEMNVAGWNRISSQTVPVSQLGTYSFIY